MVVYDSCGEFARLLASFSFSMVLSYRVTEADYLVLVCCRPRLLRRLRCALCPELEHLPWMYGRDVEVRSFNAGSAVLLSLGK